MTQAHDDHRTLGASGGAPEERRPGSRWLPGDAVRRRLQLAIVAGGTIGALARAGLERALPWDGQGWPTATFTVNVVGTLLLGYFFTRLQERLPPSTLRRPLLGTGLCGALTTFSTLQVELVDLVRHGEAGTALGYAGASLAAGLAGVYLATATTRRVRVR